MLQHIRSLFNDLSEDSKITTIFCAVYGWIGHLFLLDANTFWQFAISAGKGLGSMCATIFLGLVIKDFYTEKVKPKLFKHEKEKKTNGNEDKEAA